MKLRIDNYDYEVIIEKKKTNKNTYIRVKKDLKIYITTNTLATTKYIKELLEKNYSSIVKMVEKEKVKVANNSNFSSRGSNTLF